MWYVNYIWMILTFVYCVCAHAHVPQYVEVIFLLLPCRFVWDGLRGLFQEVIDRSKDRGGGGMSSRWEG